MVTLQSVVTLQSASVLTSRVSLHGKYAEQLSKRLSVKYWRNVVDVIVIERGVVYFVQLLLESNQEKFSF